MLSITRKENYMWSDAVFVEKIPVIREERRVEWSVHDLNQARYVWVTGATRQQIVNAKSVDFLVWHNSILSSIETERPI